MFYRSISRSLARLSLEWQICRECVCEMHWMLKRCNSNMHLNVHSNAERSVSAFVYSKFVIMTFVTVRRLQLYAERDGLTDAEFVLTLLNLPRIVVQKEACYKTWQLAGLFKDEGTLFHSSCWCVCVICSVLPPDNRLLTDVQRNGWPRVIVQISLAGNQCTCALKKV